MSGSLWFDVGGGMEVEGREVEAQDLTLRRFGNLEAPLLKRVWKYKWNVYYSISFSASCTFAWLLTVMFPESVYSRLDRSLGD